MAFDFPSNPAPGTSYTSPDGVTSFVWNGYAWMMGTGASPTTSAFVLKIGDTMSGHLTLNADPTAQMHAATKRYVDVAIAQLRSGR